MHLLQHFIEGKGQIRNFVMAGHWCAYRKIAAPCLVHGLSQFFSRTCQTQGNPIEEDGR